ncbi:MAG: CoA transferase [Gammaproteobacteria bacterium]|jgi:CoA:oxalate CoA-transferase|nr:CoA transferase [Gammaproteobacteria bacterium]MBT5334963.1 CoA transferase [Gammaproteobacteria bacterium]MBT5681822.1 CoA transferase [Gammaproteobacteria bacterium]MBT6024213.1 CoA transferase [Gammaproteobacteria bacterium]
MSIATPLAGITVLDFGQVYNGPYCGFLLAQAGARVIKVESPKGETLRGRSSEGPYSFPFTLLNNGKESITLNIKSVEGQRLLKELVPHVDVLVENFSPGTLAGYGLGSDVLRQINPRLIYAASTGYGGTGPNSDYLGMDITLQAMTGIMSVTGEEGGPPMKAGAAFCDFLGGVHLYSGIVSALYQREQSGEGAVLDISMQDCVFPTLNTQLGNFFQTGKQAPRTGNRHSGLAVAPYNIYAAKDGFVAMICLRESHWRKLCDAMGQPELAQDERFGSRGARATNMEALDELVESWTLTLSKAEIFAIALDHGMICAPVQDLDDVVNDVHLHERGTLSWSDEGVEKAALSFHTPLRFQGQTPPELTGVPNLGENTVSVLGQFLQLTPEQVEQLRQDEAL